MNFQKSLDIRYFLPSNILFHIPDWKRLSPLLSDRLLKMFVKIILFKKYFPGRCCIWIQNLLTVISNSNLYINIEYHPSLFPRNKRINLVCWEGPNIGSASTNSFHFMSQESNSSCFIEGQQYGLSLTFIQHFMLMKHEQCLHFEQIISFYSVSGKLLFLFKLRATY